MARKEKDEEVKRIIGKFPSLKMDRMICFTHPLELDLIYLLEYSQPVSMYEERAIPITYRVNGKEVVYSPSFHVVANGQNWLYDCPFREFGKSSGDTKREFELSKWCDEHSWFFKTVTANELRTGYRLENIKYLTDFSRFSILPALKSQIFAVLMQETKPIRVIDILALVPQYSRNEILPAIFFMVYHHELHLSIDDEPLSPLTIVNLYDIEEK